MKNSFISIGVGLAFLTIFYQLSRNYFGTQHCHVSDHARMDGKTVIVTGANTGIGKETALDLAKRGARVIMACRDLKKGETALNDIVEKTGSKNVVLKQLDLASLKSIREFAENVNKNEPRLHVLINNAGVMLVPELTKTEDGFEMQMGVNHLGHFLLTNLLLDLLKISTPSRIVVVSSVGHEMFTTKMKFDNINSETIYEKWDAYGQSKLANILFARELAKRLDGTGVTVNCLHPGVIFTELLRDTGSEYYYYLWPLITLFGKTIEQGAQTTIHLAVSEEVEGVTGLYFDNCKPKEPTKAAQDDEDANKLWKVSADLVRLDTTVLDTSYTTQKFDV